VFGVHRSTVARWRAEIRAALLERVRAEVRRSATLTGSQFESLLALVRSQLAVSIRAALARPPPG
jgi:RNA polymerase sigma-70 factor (ECF subfamily)